MSESKKRSLKSVALAFKGEWEVPSDQWHGVASCKSEVLHSEE